MFMRSHLISQLRSHLQAIASLSTLSLSLPVDSSPKLRAIAQTLHIAGVRYQSPYVGGLETFFA
ncbi:MAG: hypothetical protein LDL41_11550 [Coleofasciculus sp. S288]|nr:hypothetical protein [Coleofasciculus sp. S288]